MGYFSNGCEGEILDKQCDECVIPNEEPCPILLVQLLYNYDQHDKGNEKLVDCLNNLIDESGMCKMKQILDRIGGIK